MFIGSVGVCMFDLTGLELGLGCWLKVLCEGENTYGALIGRRYEVKHDVALRCAIGR